MKQTSVIVDAASALVVAIIGYVSEKKSHQTVSEKYKQGVENESNINFRK